MPEENLDTIRPISPRFFGAVLKDEGLSLSAKDSLVTEALSGRVKLDEVRGQLVRSRQQEQLGALRIEREAFMLARAREQAQREKEAVVRDATLTGTFTGLLDDPELTPKEKREAAARLRIKNPDAFARNPALRDQYGTLDDILPPRERPISAAEERALANDQRRQDQYLAQLDRQEETDRRAEAKATFDEYDAQFGGLKGARFKKPSAKLGADSSFTDEFENPAEKGAAIGFIRTYGPLAGLEIPSEEELSQGGYTELLRLGGRIDALLRPKLLSSRGALAPRQSSGLGIPERL